MMAPGVYTFATPHFAAASRFPPTAHQQALLLFIRCYQVTHGGCSPSFSEMAAGLGLRSASGVHRLIEGCAERGLLRRLPNRARAIELLIDVPVSRAPDGAPLFFVPVPSLSHGDDNA